MTVYLIRHAQAGSRSNWDGDDDTKRPLTGFGRYQSADLVGVLADVDLDEIYSSPYLRCIETVAPLGARRAMAVSVVDALAEGPADEAIKLLTANLDRNVIFCSHGDIIPELLSFIAHEYQVDLGPRPRCQKNSIWILETDVDASRVVSAVYVPPAHRS